MLNLLAAICQSQLSEVSRLSEAEALYRKARLATREQMAACKLALLLPSLFYLLAVDFSILGALLRLHLLPSRHCPPVPLRAALVVASAVAR